MAESMKYLLQTPCPISSLPFLKDDKQYSREASCRFFASRFTRTILTCKIVYLCICHWLHLSFCRALSFFPFNHQNWSESEKLSQLTVFFISTELQVWLFFLDLFESIIGLLALCRHKPLLSWKNSSLQIKWSWVKEKILSNFQLPS